MIIQNNKISLSLQNTQSMNKIGVSVPMAKDGNMNASKVEVAMDCTVQKDMGSTVYTEAEAKQLNTQNQGLSEEMGMSPADFISRCMTGEDAKAVSDEETPLEEYTSSQMERAIHRVKEQRAQSEQAVDQQVQKEQDQQKKLEESVENTDNQVELMAQIQNQLAASNLPVTGENLSLVSNAFDMAVKGQNMTEAGMTFLIANEMKVTPESVGGSVYGGASIAQAPKVTEGFDEVENQIKNILETAGLTASEENVEQAKWLYENQLPVTAENVVKLNKIKDLTGLTSDQMLARISDQMADGIDPSEIDLGKMSRAEAEGAVRDFVATDDQTLRRHFTTEADFISAKRQLEEIRLSMTVEAARTMSAKGIELDVRNLTKIVEELKLQETEARSALVEEFGFENIGEGPALMQGTMEAVKNVMAAPVEFLANTLQQNETLQTMSNQAVVLKDQYEKAAMTYEAVGTEVRTDLGDSMRKAFQNVDDILEDLGMEMTARNARAVRILGYNQMEINEANIEEMKAYDDKITSLMNRMKPQVVAKLIENQVNPLDKTMDELNEEINKIYDEVVDQDISFKKFLWKMDHHGELSKEQRESMIGVYRLLDKIEKSDGAFVGQVVKEGRELTLSSLLSASRTKRAKGMDVEVDDSFGGLSQTIAKGKSISDQILSAYDVSLVNQLKKTLTPEVLLNEEEMSLEQMLEACEQAVDADETMKEYYEVVAENIKALMSEGEGELEEILHKLDMPATLANLGAAKELMAGSKKAIYDLWDEDESEQIVDVFDQPDELEKTFEEIDEKHSQAIENQKESDDISYSQVVTLAQMANHISFFSQGRRSQMYDVPIYTEQGLMSCRVTIQSKEHQKGSVEIAMESETLGKVMASFQVREHSVKGFVTAEKNESMAQCQTMLDTFKKDLEELGFTMDSESLIRGSRTSLQVGDSGEGTKNQDLYLVAKCFIANIARKDETAYEN